MTLSKNIYTSQTTLKPNPIVMKNIIFLLLLCPIFSAAQSPFIKLDSLEFHKKIDSFIRTTQIQYQEDEKMTDSNYYKFVNPSNEKDFLTVVFERNFEGWNILNLHGSYDSLFKIWKNRFDRSANAENIRYKGFATKGRTRFEKNTENDYWKITSL